MRIEVIASDAVSAETIYAWDGLADAVATPNPFYEGWMAALAAALPEAREQWLMLGWGTAHDGSPQLDAVLPLQPRRWRATGITVALQNWDQRVRALGEPLIRANMERAFWAKALDHLDTMRGRGAYLRLSLLIADSASTAALFAELAARGRRAVVTRRQERAILNRGPTAADYIAAQIRPKVLKEHRRLRNRLAEMGPVAVERLAADADAGPWIDDLFRLEATSWKGREGVASTSDGDAERCFRGLFESAHRRGRLDFHRLRVGDTVVSTLATIAAGPTAFQIKIAYDENYARFSPGVLLEIAYLEHALSPGGPAQVDSCAREGHPMIDRIWVDRRSIVSLAVPYGGIRSRAAIAMHAVLQRQRRPAITEA